MTELEILSLLGEPDYADEDQRGASFIYLYDRFGKKDWYVDITITPEGFLSRMGWNATETLDLKQLQPRQFDRLQKHPRPTPPAPNSGYLGVALEEVNWVQDGYEYVGSHGVPVGEVVPDSPAARAGLEPGDVIEEIDGARAQPRTFSDEISKLPPGRRISLTVLRGGAGRHPIQRQTIEVTLDALETAKPIPEGGNLGIDIEKLHFSVYVRGQRVNTPQGVRVRAVEHNGPADGSGLRAGERHPENQRRAGEARGRAGISSANVAAHARSAGDALGSEAR